MGWSRGGNGGGGGLCGRSAWIGGFGNLDLGVVDFKRGKKGLK